MTLKKGSVQLACAETLAFCGIEIDRWVRLQQYASHHERPGGKKAKAIVRQVRAIHRLKIELARLCEFS